MLEIFWKFYICQMAAVLSNMFIQMRNIFAFFRDELVYSQALQSWAFVKIAYLVKTLLLAGARLLSN